MTPLAPMTELAVAMLAFLGQHVVMSDTPLRGALVRMMGEQFFTLVYSILALAFLVWAINAYEAALPETTWLWGTPIWAAHLSLILVALGFVLVVLAVLTPNPFAVVGPGLEPESVKGVFRITRHPMNWGIGLWAVAHVPSNGDTASLILFGGVAVLALLGPMGIDRRKRARDPMGFAAVAGITSYVPFAALVAGRTGVSMADVGWWRVFVALAAYFLFLALHPWLFGVDPILF